MIHIGDKFVIEVGAIYSSPNMGNRYFIKNFKTLTFDDDGINRLERYKEPPKERPHTCEYCKYGYKHLDEMPCVMCDKNVFEPKDMFRDKGI